MRVEGNMGLSCISRPPYLVIIIVIIIIIIIIISRPPYPHPMSANSTLEAGWSG